MKETGIIMWCDQVPNKYRSTTLPLLSLLHLSCPVQCSKKSCHSTSNTNDKIIQDYLVSAGVPMFRTLHQTRTKKILITCSIISIRIESSLYHWSSSSPEKGKVH